MKRVMTIEEIRAESDLQWKAPEEVETAGVCALVDVENMGWCRDGVTRWYTFHDWEGHEAIYFKR